MMWLWFGFDDEMKSTNSFRCLANESFHKFNPTQLTYNNAIGTKKIRMVGWFVIWWIECFPDE
jgi:hypothetical protein